jgi:4-amino-4-deoxy-L-arabinose transferase-like glycosyltransferase
MWSQHLILPLFMFTVTLIASLLTNAPEKTLLLALPSLAALAAFALPTLSRSVAALIDWFTLLFFTGGALIIWGVWISLQTGVPAQPAINVHRLVPGFHHVFDGWNFGLALIVTAVWLKLVHWRIGKHPSAIWKSLVLPASGATLCWVLLMTLWLPILDRALSYRPWASELSSLMDHPQCVYARGLERNQLAGLSYHGGFEFKPLRPDQANTGCSWLMAQRKAINPDATLMMNDWVLSFASKRPADKNEELLVFKRK